MESKLDLVQLRRLAEDVLSTDVVTGWVTPIDLANEFITPVANFIAATNPAVLLELLNQLEEYKHVAIARIEAACEKAKPGSILPVKEVDQASGMFS